jgi:hypothetical protein
VTSRETDNLSWQVPGYNKADEAEKWNEYTVTPRKRPEYEIQFDSTGAYSIGQVIPDSRYGSGKEDYEIRMKVWDGGGLQVSGRSRDAIRSFLDEKRYAFTSEYYHYNVRARGKAIDPVCISQKVQELGLKFLWVRVMGEMAPDEGQKK